MPAWLIAFFNSPVGKYLTKKYLNHLIQLITVRIKLAFKKGKQSAIDQENIENQKEVTDGTLSDQEDIKRTEDLLNGRKPQP